MNAISVQRRCFVMCFLITLSPECAMILARGKCNDMLTDWREFAAQHWVVGGILASLLRFLAGKQSFSNGKPNAAIGWQCLAVLIILIRSGVEGEWLGLAFGIAVLYVEVRSIRRISKTQEAKSSE